MNTSQFGQQGFANGSLPFPQNCHSMFKQISMILSEALYKIESIYSQNDVRFPIRHQLETITRIITPIELKGVIEQRETCFLYHQQKSYKFEERKTPDLEEPRVKKYQDYNDLPRFS